MIKGLPEREYEDIIGSREAANAILKKNGKRERFRTFLRDNEVIIYTCFEENIEELKVFSRYDTIDNVYKFFQGFNTAANLFSQKDHA